MGNGFTRLEYLQSTGTQWIDTKIFVDQDCEAIVECSADDFYQHYIFGARSRVGVNDMFCFILGDVANAYPQFDGNTGKYGNENLISQIKNRSTIVLNSSGCFINEKTFTTFASYSDFATPVPVALFAMREIDKIDSRTFAGKIYSFQIKKKGELLLDLIPALDSSGKPCMFDKASQIPLYNNGDGEFIYKRIENLPAALRRVEYVENTEEYLLKTNVVLTKESTVESEFAITRTWEGYAGIYGADYPFSLIVQPNSYKLIFTNDEPSGLYRYYYTSDVLAKIASCHKWQRIFVNGNQLEPTFVNGSGQNIEDGKTCYVFDSGTANNHGFMRLYSFAIMENGQLVYQLIPCIDEEEKLLLYEAVSKTKIYLPSHFVSGEVVDA